MGPTIPFAWLPAARRRTDDTGARRATVRRFGRSHRSALRRWPRPRRLGRPPRWESIPLGPIPAGPAGVTLRQTDSPVPSDPGPPNLYRDRATGGRTPTFTAGDAAHPTGGRAERTGRAGGAVG